MFDFKNSYQFLKTVVRSREFFVFRRQTQLSDRRPKKAKRKNPLRLQIKIRKRVICISAPPLPARPLRACCRRSGNMPPFRRSPRPASIRNHAPAPTAPYIFQACRGFPFAGIRSGQNPAAQSASGRFPPPSGLLPPHPLPDCLPYCRNAR